MKKKKQIQPRLVQEIPPKRKRIFFIITLLIPVFFFIILEFTLRILNYGPDLSLFQINNIHGKEYYTLNPSVKNRYFNKSNFSPDPSPENFLVSKPTGTFRIFCLGGSTTVGFPYWYNGSFSSFLRDRLKALFPDRSIEVVNLGMTATNSYTVLDLAGDLIKYEPDLFIVYDGHNEFYGALGVASNEGGINERWMVLMYLRIIHLRTFQLVKNIISDVFSMFGKTPVDNSSRVTMMEQLAKGKNVSYNSDTYNQALSVFRQNLNDLANLCRTNKIPLILGTQVSNLRDQFPFISNNSPEISQQKQSKFQQIYQSGLEFQSKGMLDSAIVILRSAIHFDSLYADAHYRLAQCFDSKSQNQEAYSEYVLARDYDELRFRTDSKFNDLIRFMDDKKYCFVADIEKDFKSLSQDSLIGHNLILEHLHPNPKGHFFIAKEYAQLMRDHGLLASSEDWLKRDTLSDVFLWEHRHITDVDEFMAGQKIELLTAGWPFRKNYIAPQPVPKTDTLRLIADQAINNRIGWVTAHERTAEFYIRRGDYNSAEKEYATIINQIPLDVTAYLRIAQLYYVQKKFIKAETMIRASLQFEQTPTAYRLLGDICLKQGKSDDAIRYYEQITKYAEDPATAPENAYMLAFAYLISEKPESAIFILEQAANRYPGYKPVQELLAKVRLVQKAHPIR